MSDLAKKNALIKELVREKHRLEEQLLTARKTLEQQAKKRLEAENKLKDYLSADERGLTNAVVVRAHIEKLGAQLKAHIELNDTLRDQRDLWIHKFNNKKEPNFDFNYLMRVCEAVAR